MDFLPGLYGLVVRSIPITFRLRSLKNRGIEDLLSFTQGLEQLSLLRAIRFLAAIFGRVYF